MAAHSLRILKDLREALDKGSERVREDGLHALDYAPGMDLPFISWQQYETLKEALESATDQDLREVLDQQIQAQTLKWEHAGLPSCTEEWKRNLTTKAGL